ncbi:hypothetical protein [Rhodococcus erythropolis]|uniref:hypothetical protein n=1 Tax=Rhodococcus erythropolis TaxID=1833 RepID=UPI002227F367|nr:hypothetical protein [Rhodococcus erythropolis]MCW2295517.1 hypothetical protein [Rhodococcus erythropolis]
MIIDGTPVDAIAFGDLGVSDDELRRLLTTPLDPHAGALGAPPQVKHRLESNSRRAE